MSSIEEHIRSEVNKQVLLDICDRLNFNIFDRKGRKVNLDKIKLTFTQSKYLFLYHKKPFWCFNKDVSPVVFLEVTRNLKPERCIIFSRDNLSAYKIKSVVEDELSYISGEQCGIQIFISDIPIVSMEELIKGYKL